MSQNRQLAAIMFTDIEGYTAIMQRDEAKALILKDRHREIITQKHAEHNGRIIQFYGDGTLSIFHSVVQAVECALQMQQLFCGSPHVPVRIGLHVGDILINDNQVFGDAVNVASRIESLSIPGAVLMSDKVREELMNHRQFSIVSLGKYHLKNIDFPVEVFALKHDGLHLPLANSLAGKTEIRKKKTPEAHHTGPAHHRNSIAILPFLNMSNDSEQDYFSEGIAEDIINSLSSIKQLKVAGRASSFQFSGKGTSLREIGEKLGVKTVLEGSVRKQLNRVRVTVQLINIYDGFQMWSERYDRNMDDIFAIQDEIAMSVTENLKLTLLEKEKKKIRKVPTQNTEAYELYLKGRFYINRRGVAILTGMKYFQLAIDLDPEFALAHAGFADANLMCASYGLIYPAHAGLNAKESADKAIMLDPTLCEPYSSLGFYYTCFEYNWKEAEKYFLKSIELNPSYAQGHLWYGLNFLSWVRGDFTKAEVHARMALQLEPMSAICYGLYAPMLHIQKKYMETIAICKKGIELDTYSFTCNYYLGWACIYLGQYEKGIAIFEKFVSLSKGHPFVQGALCICYSMIGESDKARVLLEDLKRRSRNEYITCTMIGLGAAYLGDYDEAFIYLEKGYDARDPVLLTIRYESWVPAGLKEDPRFIELINKIGFPAR